MGADGAMQAESFIPNPLGKNRLEGGERQRVLPVALSLKVAKKHSLLAEYYLYSGLSLPLD